MKLNYAFRGDEDSVDDFVMFDYAALWVCDPATAYLLNGVP